MSIARRAVLSLAALAPAIVLSCSTPPAAPPKEAKTCEVSFVTLTILATDRINPAPGGEARPVEMRIYQLKDDVRLNGEDFYRVWKDDAKALSDDIVKRGELFVYPDSRTEVRFERNPEAQYVVGVAFFRNPTGRSWFKTFELPPAPGKGDCATPACEGEGCAVDKMNPKYSLYVDGTRVDDGAGRTAERLDPRRSRVVYLSAGAEAAPKASASASSNPR